MNIHKQRGLTLIEVMVSLGILAGVTAGIVALTDQSAKDTKAAVTALHLKTVGEAGSKYIKENYAAITTLATASTPVLIRISDLIAGGQLQAGFSTANPRLQNTCLLVLEPTANNLAAMVVTEDGDTIDDLTLGQIAATIGAAGGGIYSTATTTFRGAMGGWSFATGNYANANHLAQKCDGTSGAITLGAGHPVMALWFADGLSVSGTLYRDAVPGNTALNTMNTPILMGAGTLQTVGAACTPDGALGRDTAGAVLSCQSGIWSTQESRYWKTTVANYASLPTCNASIIGESRVVIGYTPYARSRIYNCDGFAWRAMSIDDSGNFLVPNELRDNTNAKVMNAAGYLFAKNTVSSGATCTTVGAGAMARDSSGDLYICK